MTPERKEIPRGIFTDALRSDGVYGQLLDSIAKRRKNAPLPISAAGLSDGAAVALCAALITDLPDLRPVLLLCPDEKTCSSTVSSLTRLGLSAAFFPARDLNFHDLTVSREYERTRIGVLSGILRGEFDAVVTTPDAALGFTVPRERLAGTSFSLSRDSVVSPETVLTKLAAAGYRRSELAEGPGQYASRGGIIDFCVSVLPDPSAEPGSDRARGIFAVRTEFFGDEIDRICRFDTVSQRVVENIDKVDIPPQKEVIPTWEDLKSILSCVNRLLSRADGQIAVRTLENERDSLSAAIGGAGDVGFSDKYVSLIYPEKECLLDYLDGCGLCLVRDARATGDRLEASLKMLAADSEMMISSGLIPGKYAEFGCPKSRYDAFASSRQTVLCDGLAAGSGISLGGLFGFSSKHSVSFRGNEELLNEDLDAYTSGGYRVILMTASDAEASKFEKRLSDLGFICRKTDRPDGSDLPFSLISPGTVTVVPSSPLPPFELVASRVAVLSAGAADNGLKVRKTEKKQSAKGRILSFSELHYGDYVVHETHGIGKYMGITAMSVGGVTRDYITIQYAGSDRLFLPADRLERISKYIGSHSEDGSVRLSKFGSTEWGRTKARTKSALRDMAKELTELYAERMRLPGFAFSPDDALQEEFESKFEFEETEAQKQATDEIKGDMMKPVPMDRLLCGDVGYGKTEVAFRAAFKAILDRKQAAILVPTTILALQHYQTACARMRDFPVNVEMLSRLRKPKEQKKIVAALAKGDVDLIIGTHRILSKDVEFKDLGLLIVDEEQRFGVAQKEKIKQRSRGVDVLSLSATPIPRTMNMAMTGIRDISVLDEAPGARLPVQTYVLEHDDLIINEAIRRELRRGGQVFYLYNRIDSMDSVAASLREAIPDANIVTAHGGMDKERLEDIWRDMTNGSIDVLVSTTIIESGVDVPNANTLIVRDAQRMGLSQLHQLRGRVGRSPRRAYAYFTYPRDAALSEISEKRLEAIREYAEFGAGFRIAIRDLELRGAGSLLGAEQSGRVDDVGYDMYVRLLEEAVLEEKGEAPPPEPDCQINLATDAYLPESYVPSAAQRMAIYKKMANISDDGDADDAVDELTDRYGDLPAPAYALIDVALARAEGKRAHVESIVQEGATVKIVQRQPDLTAWQKISGSAGEKLRVVRSSPPSIIFTPGKKDDVPALLCGILKRYNQLTRG